MLTTGKITSKVNGKAIVVDVNLIAKYLNYVRPKEGTTNYPQSEPIDSDVVIHDLYPTVPNFAVPPHRPGKFRDTYRILNQVVHYNIFSRGAENKPLRKSAEVMYVFMNDDNYKADWARFIFEQLVDFKGDTFGMARLPFPCMITAFLRQKGKSKRQYAKLEEPSPGIISKAILVKSKSQSKASMAGTSASPSAPVPPESSLWMVLGPKASQESIWKKICCQNIAIWNCIKKEKKERKKLAREVGELKHELHWHTQYIESTSDERYEAPLRVEEEAESEEEILFRLGAAPGGQ